MAKRARASHKGLNGTGETVTLTFDISDPAERKALAAARLLAAKHGRRKQAIVALLEAVYERYEATGELMSASAISSALAGQGGASERVPVGFVQALAVAHGVKPPTAKKRGVEVVASASKASAVADNFLASMKGLASGFFE